MSSTPWATTTLLFQPTIRISTAAGPTPSTSFCQFQFRSLQKEKFSGTIACDFTGSSKNVVVVLKKPSCESPSTREFSFSGSERQRFFRRELQSCSISSAGCAQRFPIFQDTDHSGEAHQQKR